MQPLQTNTPSADPLVERFFHEFDAAFASFDGALIANRYAEPYLAARSDGTAVTFADHQDTARYFQQILDEYCGLGVHSCRHRGLKVAGLGAVHTIATVDWDLLDQVGEVVVTWRESYVLARSADESLVVRSSIDH